MTRREALAAVRGAGGGAALVAMLGFVSRDLHALGDAPGQFYLLSSMGLATPVAMGVALGHAGPVVAVEGDGSVLMNLGGLATVARYAPPNLAVVVLDNGCYETTGCQETAAGAGAVDLAAVARACGLRRVVEVDHPAALSEALQHWGGHDGPLVVVAAVEAGGAPGPWIRREPRELAARFAAWLRDHGGVDTAVVSADTPTPP